MTCALCLKVPKKTSSLTDIYSAKGQKENIEEVIKKYLWIQIDAEKNKYICVTCWKSLSAFHKFYTRLQITHNALEESVINVNFTETKEVGIEEILNEVHCDESKIKNEEVQKQLEEMELEVNPLIKLEYDNNACAINALDTMGEELLDMELEREKGIKSENDAKLLDEIEIKDNVSDPGTIENEDPFTAGISTIEDAHSIAENHKIAIISTKKEKSVRRKSTKCKSKGTRVDRKEKKISKSEKCVDVAALDNFIAQHFKLTCCLCDEQLETFVKLTRHFRLKHNQRGYVICCNKKLLKRCLLIDHINFHLNSNYFQCSRCEKALCSRASLESHIKLVHETEEPTHECKHCLKRFFSPYKLNMHLVKHNRSEEKTVPCPECDKFFVDDITMNRHLEYMHLNSSNHVCHVCGKLVRGPIGNFKCHIAKHANSGKSLSQCEICGAKVKYSMKRHMRICHSVENRTPQVCPICGKESPSVSSHKSHMKYVHATERKYACTLCDKVFKRPVTLKEHMTIHTGERLYTCPHCPKTFNSSANMHSHRKKAHPKEFEERRREKQREIFGDKEVAN